jgi:hypothetical protein
MCEVNYSVQKKKSENSKYIYSNLEQDSQIYIFEILITHIDGTLNTIRRIMKGNQGSLITSIDSLLYSNIDKIKITLLDSNNIKNEIISKITLDKASSYTTFYNNEIYFDFIKNSVGYLICDYTIS